MAKCIYYLDKLICFHGKDDSDIVIKNNNDLKEIVQTIKSGNLNSDLRVSGYKVKRMFRDFRKHFRYIEAAGGIVQNEKGDYLLIKRNGCWELPKGKIDKGETIKEAAIREVQEETGLKEVTITGKLKSTYHIFFGRKYWNLKRTYWYGMNYSGEESPIPQADEGITKAKWMQASKATRKISNSYRSVYDGLSEFFI